MINRKNNKNLNLLLGFFTVGLSLFTSCNSYKNIPYFRDLPDTTKIANIKQAPFSQLVIKPDDILSITVQTVDPLTSAIINQSVSVPTTGVLGATSGQAQTITGFLVDKNGEVQLALVGKIKLVGLTTDQARDTVTSKVSKYYKNPTVQVRFTNFNVTLIGEVLKPATYVMANEKVSILDALGAAGDLTIYGKRENVLLIRDNNGEKQFVRFNLNSSEIFKSPFFYLKQNDVIYVEPNKSKASSTDASKNRLIAITAAALSLIIVIVSRIK